MRVEAPSAPDDLADSVLAQLGRPSESRKSWGAFLTLTASFLTFGLLPPLVILRRHRRQVEREQEGLWHLAEWMRTRSGHSGLQRLLDAADQTGPIRPLLGLAGASLLAVGLCLAFAIADSPDRSKPLWLFFSTFGYPWGIRDNVDSPGAWRFYTIWAGGLTLASVVLYVHIQCHARRIHRFVWIFNESIAREGLAPVDPIGIGLGLRPGFILAAVVLLTAGAPWGVPAMLTAGLYRTYCHIGRTLRQRLAERLRGMLLHRRPEIFFPRPIWTELNCPGALCLARLPREAAFCPRCGTRCASLDLMA